MIPLVGAVQELEYMRHETKQVLGRLPRRPASPCTR